VSLVYPAGWHVADVGRAGQRLGCRACREQWGSGLRRRQPKSDMHCRTKCRATRRPVPDRTGPANEGLGASVTRFAINIPMPCERCSSRSVQKPPTTGGKRVRNIVQGRFVGRGAGGGSAPTAMAAAAPAQGVKSGAAAGTNVKPSAATQKQASNTSGTTTAGAPGVSAKQGSDGGAKPNAPASETEKQRRERPVRLDK
jgi:hypothetical protein